MTLRSNIAQLTSGVLTWGLKHVVHRPGATLPGNVALRIDPAIVCELRGKLRRGSIVVSHSWSGSISPKPLYR